MFRYDRPNGSFADFHGDIDNIFKQRRDYSRPWYRSGRQSGKTHTICEIFNIPWNRLKEMRMSRAYKLAAKEFIENQDLPVSEGEDSWFRLMVFLGVIFSEADLQKYRRSAKYENTIKTNTEGEWFDSNGNVVKNYRPGRTMDDVWVGQKNNVSDEQRKVDYDTISGRNNTRKLTKMEVYRLWNEKNFDNVSKGELCDAVRVLIESRDYWKGAHDSVSEDRNMAVELAGDLETKIEELKESVNGFGMERARMQSTIEYLQQKIRLFENGTFSSDDDFEGIDDLLSGLSETNKKSLRRTVLLATHPDKVSALLESKSDEDKQAYNRFFDLINKKLS